MPVTVPSHIPADALRLFILAMADDELILGHRDSEWTGYAPILEEDIAFSNIAQDELGHSLVWYSLLQELGGESPDTMAFRRTAKDFVCCRFVTYPKGDFAYTVVRQYLFDVAERIRLQSLTESSFDPFRETAEKLFREEEYHLLHIQGLVERLGDATEESHRRMQAAVDESFPQGLGLFETLKGEEELRGAKVFSGNDRLRAQWIEEVVPVLSHSGLTIPVKNENETHHLLCTPDEGGRVGKHTEYLNRLIEDLQLVYRMAPDAAW